MRATPLLRRWRELACVAAAAGLVAAAAPAGLAQNTPASDGWHIPADAVNQTNPLAPGDTLLKRGRDVYDHHCATCHGHQGKGDGPSGDEEHPPADLTDPARAEANPDGVVFYKVWNGRKSPRMPAFKSRLSKEEAWAVVAYVKTLRPVPQADK